MSGSAKLSTVIFDMDGCLTDTEQAYIQAWAHAFEVKGIPIASEELISWAGTGKNEINDIVTGIVGSRELAMELRQIREDYFYVLLERGNIYEKPYASEILDFLKRRGIRTAVASSTFSDRGNILLEYFKFRDKLDCVTWGDEVEHPKPSPDPYLKTLEKCRVSREECIVFEDSYNGVLAALNAGLRVIHVPDTSVKMKKELPPVYTSVHDFKEGMEVIRGILESGN